MRTRVILGLVLVLLGALWFAQGIGVAKGSPMTSHSQWSWIGGGLVVVGAGLLLWAFFMRRDGVDG